MKKYKLLRTELENKDRIIKSLLEANKNLVKKVNDLETENGYLHDVNDWLSDQVWKKRYSSAHGFRNENEYLGGR